MNVSPECWIFFVTDNIKKGEVKVAFCPMTNMQDHFHKATAEPIVCMNARKDSQPAHK